MQRLWEEMLGDEFLLRPRLSRIYYDGKFLAYPLQARDVVSRLGLVESALLRAVVPLEPAAPRPSAPETFEDWVTARFGRRLYDAFFRSYTREGVGHPRLGDPVRVGRAADQGLLASGRALLGVLAPAAAQRVTTLIEEFHYPRLGPGPDVGALAASASRSAASRSSLNHRVHPVRHDDDGVDRDRSVGRTAGEPDVAGRRACSRASRSASSSSALDPPPPDDVVDGRAAASATATSASSRS